jgi:hypothetical protein
MQTVDLSDAEWRKSSYSGGSGQQGSCVEVAFTGRVAVVRDSKAPDGGVLVVPESAWLAFLRGHQS